LDFLVTYKLNLSFFLGGTYFLSLMGMVPPKVKIDMDEVRTVANNLTKEKQVDKVQSPKVFSVKGVQEIARKIKEQEQNNDKDKKRSQTLSR